jgi:hypothetical protein
MNNGTQAIDGQPPQQRRVTGRGADNRRDAGADAETGGNAPQRHQRIALQFAGASEIDEGREDDGRRRRQPSAGPAHAHDEFPCRSQRHRKQKPKRRPRQPRPAISTRALLRRAAFDDDGHAHSRHGDNRDCNAVRGRAKRSVTPP